MRAQGEERGAGIGPPAGVFVSLAGVSAALTILFLSMRSVMKIGGFCASGQSAFVIAHQCPKGVPLLMLGAVWGGLGASTTPPGRGGQDVVGLLERLDALHRTGSLSDEEYERAKQEILRRGSS